VTSREHGNAKYHLEKCRCGTCCQAARDYENNRYRAIAYGRWHPFVDAEFAEGTDVPADGFGIGWIRVAKLAGVSTGGVSKLLYGDRPRGLAPTKRVRPETALKLLAVEPTLANLGARTPIDATGTRRRLQALVAKGWTQSELARRLGMDRANFGRTIVSSLVEAGTARAVLALYDELWRLDPTAEGVPRYRAEAARLIARNNRWAPIGAWDDESIDDPAAAPDWTGRCGTLAGRRDHHRLHIPMCEPCRTARREARQTAA
jgi:hypothetical protein